MDSPAKLALELAANRIVTVDRFLSPLLCQQLLDAISSGNWVPSGVAADLFAPGRSSSTLFARRYSRRMETSLRRIERSLLAMFNIQPANLEPWQVTRYKPGEAFDYHLDCGPWRHHRSGERRRTILIYLEQPAKGGATHFRALRKTIAPLAGRLAVWENLLTTGNCDHSMIHSGRRIWRGCKTTLVTWERECRYIH